jgi:hypothetical protein
MGLTSFAMFRVIRLNHTKNQCGKLFGPTLIVGENCIVPGTLFCIGDSNPKRPGGFWPKAAAGNMGKIFAYPFSMANGMDLIVTLPDLRPLHCAVTVIVPD